MESRLSDCFFTFEPKEQIAGTLAHRAFLIFVVARGFALRAVDPIRALNSCVDAVAALFADGFATTTVCHPAVVAGGATFRTTRNG